MGGGDAKFMSNLPAVEVVLCFGWVMTIHNCFCFVYAAIQYFI